MGSRLTVGLLFTATRRVDENEARVPPPPATPLQFPSCHPQEQSSTWLDQLDVVKLFKDLFAPGAQLKHLEALGIIHTNNIRLERILPDDYLPPNSWFEDDALTEDYESSDPPPRKQVLSNGRAAPNRKDFYDLIKELSHDNGDAFRAARRQPAPPGRQAPKIVHSRKVWNGLADMAEYWDVSLDRYLEDNDQKDSDAMDVDELGTGIQESRGENPEETKKKTYMGRRTNTSSKMPKAFREDTVYGFIEMVVWAFGCTLENPTTLQSQKLLIQNIFFTLPYFKSVHRMPEDRRKARAGIKEGPLVGIFCRNQTQFLNADESEGSGKGEIFDLLKESGILTLIAQKRAREGKEPDNPGAGKWWATAPRWGGGKGGEFGGADDEPVEDPSAAPGNGPQPRKRTKRASQEEMWRAMRPPPSLWEKGIEYHCIGKGKGNDYDDIYLISSLNHHISILHTRIHNQYLEYLSAKPNANNTHTSDPATAADNNNRNLNAPQQKPWYGLTIQRSKWYDLFSAEDRVELLRGVWGIMMFLMRAVPEEETKEEESSEEIAKGGAGGDDDGKGRERESDDKHVSGG